MEIGVFLSNFGSPSGKVLSLSGQTAGAAKGMVRLTSQNAGAADQTLSEISQNVGSQAE